MDLNRKLELIKMNVQSVSRHRDEDADVRRKALAIVLEMIEDELHAIDDEVGSAASNLKKPD